MLNGKGNKIKQQAVQTWLLGRSLPFLIIHFVPKDDLKFIELIVLVLQMLEIIFSTYVNKFMIAKLEELVNDHHLLFCELFPDTNMINKHHHLLHYVDCLVKSGPLQQCSCMRYETKHFLLKKQILVAILKMCQNL